MHLREKFAAACIATALAGTGMTYAQMNDAYAGTTPAAQVERTAHAAAAAQGEGDADRYAACEQQAAKQQAYQGGGYLVVGISTTAAIIARGPCSTITVSSPTLN